MTDVIYKRCFCCQQPKLLSEFYKDRTKKDGVEGRCKMCCRETIEEYQKSDKGSQMIKRYRSSEERSVVVRKYNRSEKGRSAQRRENERVKRDIGLYLRKCISTRIHHALKENKLSGVTSLLGCTIKELKLHLESQFQEGMTWENYGKWHIDHIKPCAVFDLSRTEDQKECFHFSNLQPLWAMDNLRKNAKYEKIAA